MDFHASFLHLRYLELSKLAMDSKMSPYKPLAPGEHLRCLIPLTAQAEGKPIKVWPLKPGLGCLYAPLT